MKDRLQMALAVAVGYYLGRRHKLRMAAGLALAGAAKRFKSKAKSGEGGLLQQGIKALGSSPELEELTERVRGDLIEVGKAAAVAATSRQIDSLSDRLHERAEALRRPGVPRGEERAEEPTVPRTRRPAEEEYVEYGEYDETGEEEREAEPARGPAKEPPGRERATPPVTRARR